MKNLFSFLVVLAVSFVVSSATAQYVPQRMMPPARATRSLPPLPPLPVPPMTTSAAPLQFGMMGLQITIKNDIRNRGEGYAEPLLMGAIEIDGVPAPPSPVYGRYGGLVPYGEAVEVQVNVCLNPNNCRHVIRVGVWYSIQTLGPGGIPVLLRGSFKGCVEKPFTGDARVVVLDDIRLASTGCPKALGMVAIKK